ncbi:MAG: hypothetical protein ACREPX_09875 [Rhodanobacteraceae bacterium]
MMRLLVLATAAVALAACGGSASDDSAEAAKPVAQAPAKPAQKTVFDDQLKALQKAKDVQKTVDDAAKATDKAIDDSGG